MSEIMIRFDDLRRYCEKRGCSTVPMSYIKQKTICANEVKIAHWQFNPRKDGSFTWKYTWKCTNCNGNFGSRFRLCPFCGAEMR